MIRAELDKWSALGVEGHFNGAPAARRRSFVRQQSPQPRRCAGAYPWKNIDEFLTPLMAKVPAARSRQRVRRAGPHTGRRWWAPTRARWPS
jgi:hypothetical protein